jgi:hypothetical protein
VAKAVSDVFPQLELYLTEGNIVAIAHDGAARDAGELARVSGERHGAFQLRYDVRDMPAPARALSPAFRGRGTAAGRPDRRFRPGRGAQSHRGSQPQMAEATGRAVAISIYGKAFVIGGVLMGFKMLGSRYLYPYFGAGIGTWARLISTVPRFVGP